MPPDVPIDGFVPFHPDKEGRARPVRPMARLTINGKHSPQREKPRILDLNTFLRLELPPRESLLDPNLPAKGLAMLYGPRGLGKTHVALGIAYAVASGGAFFRWRAKSTKRVLYVDGEMPAATLQERLNGIIKGAGPEPMPRSLHLHHSRSASRAASGSG